MYFRRISVIFAAAVGLAACQSKSATVAELPTATVARANIAVRVQATGTVTPIDPVDVKSRAQGMITSMAVDVGSVVKKGQQIVKIDPRDVQNQFNQAMADDVVSSTTLDKARKERAREDSLFAVHVITASEHDSTNMSFASAAADLVSKRASLDLARQNLQDATLEAPISGTVIARPVTQGQIIVSALSANGGTLLMTIADLSRVRMQVTVDEVEMGNVRVGLPATVAVDAFPDRTFNAIVEKIEPQAQVVQGVTFFPVQISIDNKEGLLMPGMNGEVTIKAQDLTNVVAVPIDAIRSTNELAAVSRMFRVPIDTLNNEIRPDLLAGEGTTGVPGRYAVVQTAPNQFEMRLVKTGPTDLKNVEVLDGLKEGDKVALLGAVLTSRPAVAPKLTLAANLLRGSAVEQSAQAGKAATRNTKPQPAQSGTPAPASKNTSKP
ncbi:MAG TPA: efflux RND transporter periplasmic adaptor subunit [Gemmatimonadaceae bacterium]|nr:efflux RND transporter periplasmic adaptor subunit [Gemmatimonadaceae bacterium]